MTTLNKSLMFTDIHFGRRNNSIQHNEDCIRYIQWLCEIVKKESPDHIIFLGDFFQTRTSIDISTIKYATQACNLLNQLGIPIYMIVGNHDLYHKHSRDVHSPIIFAEFSNFIIIDEPQMRTEIGSGSFLSPYLFKSEYATQPELKKQIACFGHFEFSNFYVTGYYKVKHENGPQPEDFGKPKVIFSGHYHQRQIQDNIVYIGNTFGFDFSDLDDVNKGCCLYEHDKDEYRFVDWPDSLLFTQINASELLESLDNGVDDLFKDDTSLNCLIDVHLTYEQHLELKKRTEEIYKLRQFKYKELSHVKDALEDTNVDDDIIDEIVDDELVNMNDLVIRMLDQIDVDEIDNETLKKIYTSVKNDRNKTH